MKPHKWAKEIKAWADGAEIEARTLSFGGTYTDWYRASSPLWDTDDVEYRIKPQGRKCITKDCTNHTDEGKFIGDLCVPCWEYITNGKGIHSQAYRNAQPKEPQYLYVYQGVTDMWLSPQKHDVSNYVGKIKLENEE